MPVRTPGISRVFDDAFGAGGDQFTVEAPGRANLIGEHIDYNGLAVLPMALDRRITLRSRPRADGRVRIHNVRPEYQPVLFDLAETIPPDPPGHWSNYLRAAAQALSEDHGPLRGIDAVVGSDLPAAAGLSSSSALVVATALALLNANDRAYDRLALAARLAEAERYVGLAGGGMDQAICLGAEPGCASLVTFDPLGLVPIPVPPAWRVVVAHSLVPAEKSAGAKRIYNRRTEECRLALQAVAARLGLPAPVTYGALLDAFAVDELVAVGDTGLDDHLARRFRHVVTESRRVGRAVDALRGYDLEAFGTALVASHASLRDDYHVSCPELNELVDLALAGGAAGARLTGAGLGGSIVALVTADDADLLLEHLDGEFYRDRVTPDALSDLRFVAEPGAGARVEAASS